jgi:hypothetical protein
MTRIGGKDMVTIKARRDIVQGFMAQMDGDIPNITARYLEEAKGDYQEAIEIALDVAAKAVTTAPTPQVDQFVLLATSISARLAAVELMAAWILNETPDKPGYWRQVIKLQRAERDAAAMLDKENFGGQQH